MNTGRLILSQIMDVIPLPISQILIVTMVEHVLIYQLIKERDRSTKVYSISKKLKLFNKQPDTSNFSPLVNFSIYQIIYLGNKNCSVHEKDQSGAPSGFSTL